MTYTNHSIALPETLNQAVIALSHGKAGDNLNNILSEYPAATNIAAAVERHLKYPVIDSSPVKRRSYWLDPRRVQALRAYALTTYVPFDSLLRILVQDHFSQQGPQQ